MKKTDKRQQRRERKYFQLRRQISLNNMLANDFSVKAELCERAARIERKFPELSEAYAQS